MNNLPIKINWDKLTKVHIVITHMEISNRDISNEIINPIPVESVDGDIVIPYPKARQLMEMVIEFVNTNPEGIKLNDCTGRLMLNFETGELYPEDVD